MLELVSALKVDPIPYRAYDVSRLQGREDTYRIRLGGIRVVYHVDWGNSVVDIEYVGPRALPCP